MMSVELLARVCGGYVVVLRGELDTADAESTASAVAELAEGGQRLIIDLEALEYIDCHALSGLLRARVTARQAGGDVLLAAPHGLVLRLLTLVGVPGVVASASTVAAGTAGGGGAGCARELPVRRPPERRA
jgi:anti-sigma B factor antagonist